MNHHLTISRFAQLRGIDINSLRYYEKLGILTPAHTDPRTRYRYYDVEQLYMLDAILLCVNLGIPLKQLADYRDASGNYQSVALFNEGRRRADEKITELQNSLRCIERTLTYLNDTARYADTRGPYRRTIPRRQLISAEYEGDMAHADQLETAFSELNRAARERGLNPVMPMSILYRYSGDGLRRHVCWDIADEDATGAQIATLPGGEYRCLQFDWDAELDPDALIRREFDVNGGAAVVVANIGRSRQRSGVRLGEIQLLSAPAGGAK